MTDTTDIKALRSESANLMILLHKEELGVDVTLTAAKFFDDVFRMLEAERQRAEDGVKAHRVHAARLIDERGQLRERAEKAEAELAALKGDQVPVEYQQRTKPKWDDHHPWSDWEKCSEGTYNDLVKADLEICDWIHEVRELFTAPQKPVLLPSEYCQSCDRYYVDGMKAGWNFHEEEDNQGFINSIERVQKDMREARKEQVKNDA